MNAACRQARTHTRRAEGAFFFSLVAVVRACMPTHGFILGVLCLCDAAGVGVGAV